uniref:Phosphoribosylaminoimidazole-succinocarboxamide synthase n=1 Tax=Lygus hesperus TaxID=30085 RepID=A0A0A9WRK2_LYGHE
MLRKLVEVHPEYATVCKYAICTGQCILLSQQIPEDKFEKELLFMLREKERAKVVERHYKLSARYVGEKKIDLSANGAIANAIIGKAISAVYANHVGASYIDVNSYKENQADIVTMEAIVPKAMRVRITNMEIDVLQVDVRYAVSQSRKLNCLTQLNDLRRVCRDEREYQKRASEQWIGKKVATFYAKGKNVVLKIIGICFNLSVDSDA